MVNDSVRENPGAFFFLALGFSRLPCIPLPQMTRHWCPSLPTTGRSSSVSSALAGLSEFCCLFLPIYGCGSRSKVLLQIAIDRFLTVFCF